MPTTITTFSGSYHLWQLPDLSAPTPSESIEFNTLDNDLSNGYRSTALFGSNAGLRTFELKLPTLAHKDVANLTVTDINGATVSREQYVWELYCECKVTGKPFVYQSSRNNQYYLVRFLDKDLTYERMKVKIYSSGIKLQQIRLEGESVFDVAQIPSPPLDAWCKDATGIDQSGNGNGFTESGDVGSTTPSGVSFDVWQFNGSTNTGKAYQTGGSVVIYDLFILMSNRTETFNQDAGVFTGTTATPILVGTNGGTKFQNQVLSGFEYRYNDVLYNQTDQHAPMDGEWGLVHCHWNAGSPSLIPQIGQDRNLGTSTKADIDVAEVVICDSYLPHSTRRELVEYLMIKKNLLNNG